MRAPTVALIAIALAAAGATGCGESKRKPLDTERIERAIERSILQKRRLQMLRVSCPSGIERKKGSVFRCIATFKGGSTPFIVKQDDDKGSVHYRGLKK